MQTMIRNGLTSDGLQLITRSPSILDQLPTAGPQYEASYNTSDNEPIPSCEEVNQKVFNHKISNSNSHEEPTSSKVKPLPKRSCIVIGTTLYPLSSNLLAHPHMDHFFVKERSEIKPGHFLAKLALHHQNHDKTR